MPCLSYHVDGKKDIELIQNVNTEDGSIKFYEPEEGNIAACVY